MTYDKTERLTPRKHTRMSRLQARQRRSGQRNRIYRMALVIWREKRHELLAKITRQKLTIVERDREIRALKAQLDSFTRAD